MTFSFEVRLNDPLNSIKDPAIVASAQSALSSWSQYLSGIGTLVVEINVTTNVPTGVDAFGVPNSHASIGTDGSRSLMMSGASYKLATGIDINGDAPDAHINIQATTLPELWFGPNDAIPSGMLSGRNIILHELAHVFGVLTFRDKDTGALTGSSEQLWDKSIQINPDGTAVFVGLDAEAIFGGPVPLTTALFNGTHQPSYIHIGNSANDIPDLLNAFAGPNTPWNSISLLDRALLADAGAPVIGFTSAVIGTIAVPTIKTANLGILRVSTSDADVSAVATKINAGQLTLVDYVNQLASQAQSTTIPALVTYDFFFGKTPASGGVDFLTHFAAMIQTPAGGGFSVVNTFVNLAATNAINPSSTFDATFGAGSGASEQTFFTNAYTQLFGHAPSQAAIDNYFHTQTFNLPNGTTITGSAFDFYREYVRESLPAAQQTAANLENGARGCVVGSLLYFAETTPTTQYAQATTHFLQDAAVETPHYQVPLIGAYLASSTPQL